MSRIERRMAVAALGPRREFNPEQPLLESAVRARAARRIRSNVRRGSPVALYTPRWSLPQGFLEDVAIDLAVGEPGVGCRTVNFRPVQGRPTGEVWQFTLQLFAQLGRRGWVYRAPSAVASRTGFRALLGELLEAADDEARSPVALLACGVEHLPVQVLEDIGEVWEDYCRRPPESRRAAVLMAGTVRGAWTGLAGVTELDLVDYGEGEAAELLMERSDGLPREVAEQVVRFTGGIPGLVEAAAARLASGADLPAREDALLASLGAVADELRGAVDIAASDAGLADRLMDLLPGEPLTLAPDVDQPLLDAGLLRAVRSPGPPRVAIRAPAIAALVA